MLAVNELINLDACPESVNWSRGYSKNEAWEKCDRGDWLFWYAVKNNCDEKKLTLAKVLCANLVINLINDDRSIMAINAAKKYVNEGISITASCQRGARDACSSYVNASIRESDAAWTAYATVSPKIYAYAAYSRLGILYESAQEIRKCITLNDL